MLSNPLVVFIAGTLFGAFVSQNYNIPYAVFTEPEIATIGISEEEALRKNIKIKVGKFQFAANARALSVEKSPKRTLIPIAYRPSCLCLNTLVAFQAS